MHVEIDRISSAGLQDDLNISSTTSAPPSDEGQLYHTQMVREQPTPHSKLIFLLGTWRLGDVFEMAFSLFHYKWPILFQPLEVISFSGLQVQKALVKKTLRHKTAVQWGICLLHRETSPSIEVSLSCELRHGVKQVRMRSTCRGSFKIQKRKTKQCLRKD